MAAVFPFRALRPTPSHAAEVACVPYDVVNTDEARRLAVGKPLSFLHVIRPEIDLPVGTDEHADAVYAQGAANLAAFRTHDAFVEEAEPALYAYRLIMDGRAQTGLYACVSVAEYDANVILKHEKTRPDKEDDRTRHILTQQAHAEPVMLAYRSTPDLDRALRDATLQAPLFDFVAEDGIQHTIWRVAQADALVEGFQAVPNLYVADGHHRSAAASRAAQALPDNPEAQRFLAVLFPVSQMRILAYNRVVYHLPGGKGDFLARLRERFFVEAVDIEAPTMPGRVCLYLGGGGWYRISLPPTARPTVADRLDVARLNEHLLEPMLGIHDPRTDTNIGFVGGIRGTGELKHLVDSGQAALAISMFPTSAQELLAVSDAGQLMPPKSTWFEPKLRSGLLVHTF